MKDTLNIAFYTSSQPIPTVGGVERATITTANMLRLKGHHVYSIYLGERNFINSVFEDECSINHNDIVGQISDFLIAKAIDVIVIQTAFGMVRDFKKAISCHPCKIVTVYHFEPIWDKHFIVFSRSVKKYQQNKTAKNLLKLIGYPFFKLRHLYFCHRSFQQGYRSSDKIVLLSKEYITSFLKYVGDENTKKIEVIPNAIPNDIPSYDYQPKQKMKLVLIVSRLEDVQKRISIALDLWKEINKYVVENGWSLMIVGDGEARKLYENYIRKHRLKNVTLEGQQVPWDYYKRASIFLMTSRSEGWGLTLLEAQRYGVVPICFDTFGAAKDVIEDKISGYLIPDGHKDEYKKAILSLMENNELRNEMALAGIQNVRRFSEGMVGDKWNDFLCRVVSEDNK